MSLQVQKRYSLPQAHRVILHESCYFDHLHKSLRFLLASNEDLSKIGEYLSEQWDDHWPQLLSIPLNQLISQHFVLMATDYFEICGLLVGQKIQIDKELVGEGKEWNGKGRNVEVMFVEMVQSRKEYEKSDLIKQQLLIECFKHAQFTEKLPYVVLSVDPKIVSNLNINAKNANYLNDFLPNNSNKNQLLLIDLRDAQHLLNKELKTPSAYQLNPSLKRRVLKRFIPKRLGRELLVQIALPEDEPVFRHFMINEFMQQTPVNKTLQFKEAETLEHYNTRIENEQFHKGLCLMVVDEGKICAAGTCKEIFDPAAKRQRQAIRIPVDLKKESDKIQMSTEKARMSQAINVWMSAFVSQFLPYNIDKYMRIEMRSVHPYYVRCGIAGLITEATDQVIREHGYQYFQTLYLAHAMTRHVEGKEPYPPVAIRFPYSAFLYNGKQVIKGGKISDGGEYISINVGPVRQSTNVVRETQLLENGENRVVAKL